MTPLEWVSVELLVIMFWGAVAYICRKKPVVHVQFKSHVKRPTEDLETALLRCHNICLRRQLRKKAQKRDGKGKFAK